MVALPNDQVSVSRSDFLLLLLPWHYVSYSVWDAGFTEAVDMLLAKRNNFIIASFFSFILLRGSFSVQ